MIPETKGFFCIKNELKFPRIVQVHQYGHHDVIVKRYMKLNFNFVHPDKEMYIQCVSHLLHDRNDINVVQSILPQNVSSDRLFLHVRSSYVVSNEGKKAFKKIVMSQVVY